MNNSRRTLTIVASIVGVLLVAAVIVGVIALKRGGDDGPGPGPTEAVRTQQTGNGNGGQTTPGDGGSTGGQSGPRLALSGTSFVISSRSGKANFFVSNSGQDTLTWTSAASHSWLTLSGAVQGSATSGQRMEIAVLLLNPPDGESTAGIAINSNGGKGHVTITTNLDEAPLLSVWFATENGTTLSRLCVGDRVNMTARPSDPDGVASVMGAVSWMVGNQSGGTPLHEMRYDALSQTYLLGTIDISRSAQWFFTVRAKDSGGNERKVVVRISIGLLQPDNRVCTTLNSSEYEVTPQP